MLLPIVDTDPVRPVTSSSDETLSLWLIDRHVTRDGYRVTRYGGPLQAIPADFFADPDGRWTFEALAAAAGFGCESGVAVGALRQPLFDHPDGAAVVTLESEARPYVAIVECPIAYELAEDWARSETSAA